MNAMYDRQRIVLSANSDKGLVAMLMKAAVKYEKRKQREIPWSVVTR